MLRPTACDEFHCANPRTSCLNRKWQTPRKIGAARHQPSAAFCACSSLRWDPAPAATFSRAVCASLRASTNDTAASEPSPIWRTLPIQENWNSQDRVTVFPFCICVTCRYKPPPSASAGCPVLRLLLDSPGCKDFFHSGNLSPALMYPYQDSELCLMGSIWGRRASERKKA